MRCYRCCRALTKLFPVQNLRWRDAPELVDLDGDGAPDDMNGDELIDAKDRAWVVTLQPRELLPLPQTDTRGDLFDEFDFDSFLVCGTLGGSGGGDGAAIVRVDGTPRPQPDGGAAKQDDPDDPDTGDPNVNSIAIGGPGDDLFITVKTSESMRRFEQFRAVIPATLPERTETERVGGVQTFPQFASAPSAFTKSSPDEDPVQDFYGHDMLEVNVPVRLVNLSSQSTQIQGGGAALPVLGIDMATNRPEGTVASGETGAGSDGAFVVPNAVGPRMSSRVTS